MERELTHRKSEFPEGGREGGREGGGDELLCWLRGCYVTTDLCAGVIPLQKGYTNVPVSSFSLPDSVEDWDDSSRLCV